MEGVGDCLKEAPPHVLPRPIWSFFFKQCSHRGNPKIGERFGPAPWVGMLLIPKNKLPPHRCYHVKFSSYASKGVRINIRNHQNWGALGLTILRRGVADPLQIRPSHHAEFGRSSSNGTSVIKGIRLEMWLLAFHLPKSSRVIRIN